MRRLTIPMALAACSTGGMTDDSPSGRADARAVGPQSFACDGTYAEGKENPPGLVMTWRYATIGKLNPAEAPSIDAWVCDFSCGTETCGCLSGKPCSPSGDSIRADTDGWCTSATVTVRPNGDAIVICGSDQSYGQTSYGTMASRVYVRM